MKTSIGRMAVLFGLTLALGLVTGCGSEEEAPTGLAAAPTLNMNLPDSLTGGVSGTTALNGFNTAHGEPHCTFTGAGSDNPFENGYHMTRFLVGATAQWTCFSDFIVTALAMSGIPVDGQIHDITNPDDPGGPTGVSVTQDTPTQITARLFFGGDTTTPGMFLSWNTSGGSTQGRLILGDVFTGGNTDPNAPNALRLDFEKGTATHEAEMFIGFPTGNTFTNGFRIQVSKNLDTTAYPTYTALGLLDMKAQWDTGFSAGHKGILPALRMYTISDGNGLGAAVASFADVGASFDLSAYLLGHLGHYQYTKDDYYYFTSQGAPQYIYKSIASASYLGHRTSNATNLDDIESFLGLGGTYFDTTCNGSTPNCQAFMQAVYANSDWGQEANMGSNPNDERSTIINAVTNASYLASSCPGDASGCVYDPTDVFEMTFIPTN